MARREKEFTAPSSLLVLYLPENSIASADLDLSAPKGENVGMGMCVEGMHFSISAEGFYTNLPANKRRLVREMVLECARTASRMIKRSVKTRVDKAQEC